MLNNRNNPLIELRTILLTAVYLAAFIFAYFPTLNSLIRFWYQTEEHSHGFFIIPICIYIAWTKRSILADIEHRPSSTGLLIIIFSLLAYLFSTFAEILTVKGLSMIPFCAGVIVYLYGYRMLKEVIFPLFFLIFMVPVPAQIYSSLTIPLQLLVSKISTFIASCMGIPIFREGNIINLPNQTLQVVQACSGLRSLVSLLALSAVFGYITLQSNILRSLLFFSGIPVAIIVNVFRVLLMIVSFYYLNYDLTRGGVHTIFGMLLFVFALTTIGIIKGVLAIWDNKSVTEK